MAPKAKEAKTTSDPRFATLHTDPRFIRSKRQQTKVVLDDRFRDLLQTDQKTAQSDKYGRKVSSKAAKKELQNFYQLDKQPALDPEKALAYARGELLMESSDEESEQEEGSSDEEGSIELGPSAKGRQYQQESENEEDFQVDLDENDQALLPSDDEEAPEIHPTKRLAAVNMDWDHVRAIDLFKVFSSVLSLDAPDPSALSAAPLASTSKSRITARIARGRVLSVAIYPSDFGKERLAREEREGPPPEIFASGSGDEGGGSLPGEDEIDETDVLKPDRGEEFNQKALRRYQLERLRYYYAVIEFSSPSAAKHAYEEVQNTEFERSANTFDLRFVPDEMTFDQEPKETADSDQADYQPNEYVTDALCNSKVKLTWDEDDPQRTRLTRLDTTKMSKTDVDKIDFQVYLASSDSNSENSENDSKRDRFRKLLGLDGAKSSTGGKKKQKEGGDMEITFAPALADRGSVESDEEAEENTIEKYKRKEKERKERKKLAKTQVEEKSGSGSEEGSEGDGFKDTFFDEDVDMAAAFEAHDEGEVLSDPEAVPASKTSRTKKSKAERQAETEADERQKAELSLLVDEEEEGGKHFDMTEILRAEKEEKGGKKSRGARRKLAKAKTKAAVNDTFQIDVEDDRFKSLHKDHQFAIDPSNPRFQKTKNMDKLLEASRKKRDTEVVPRPNGTAGVEPRKEVDQDIASLVASVKRKSQSQKEVPKKKKRKMQ